MGLQITATLLLATCASLVTGFRSSEQPSLGRRGGDAPIPPVWPESYSLSYSFTLPYTGRIQPDPITYPVLLYRQVDENGKAMVAMSTCYGSNYMVAREVGYLCFPPPFYLLVFFSFSFFGPEIIKRGISRYQNLGEMNAIVEKEEKKHVQTSTWFSVICTCCLAHHTTQNTPTSSPLS
jgi:hypothetical protein